MRTTVRIDDDLLSRLKRQAQRESISLTQLVNRVLRVGLRATDRVADEPGYVEQTYAMGAPHLALQKAGLLAALLEDEETIRKLALRK